MSKKKPFNRRLKQIGFALLAILILANLGILFSGKTYLYKGIKETYLKGKKGPDIYDSIVFPTRKAQHDIHPYTWEFAENQIKLSEKSKNYLKKLETTSFLIIKDRKIIHESYFDNHQPSTKSNSFSMGKSLVGMLVLIARDDGLIENLNDPIEKYLPFSIPNGDKVSIRQVLGMSSGLNWSESGANPFSDNAEAYYSNDLEAIMKKKKFEGTPGTIYEYKSGNTQLLGYVIKQVTGKYPTEYFEEKVWSKIGSEHDVLWSLDHKNGVEKAYCCVYASTRDYAKLGQLILNGGKWENETIIAAKTLTELSTPFNIKYPFYGLQFWMFNHPVNPAIYFRGILGQYVIAIPSLNVVMVRTGHLREKDYFIPKEKKEDPEFLEKNEYKEYHPSDLFKYYEILDEVLSKENNN